MRELKHVRGGGTERLGAVVDFLWGLCGWENGAERDLKLFHLTLNFL